MAIALIGHSVSLAVSDIGRYEVIVATKVSEKPMVIRDAGPLLIVYALDGPRDGPRSSTFNVSMRAWSGRFESSRLDRGM